MSAFIVDIEADGPIPGEYSMIEIGAVKLTEGLDETFHIQIKPISQHYLSEVLKITGHTREETQKFEYEAAHAMFLFSKWVEYNNTNGKPLFFSDNNGFDYMFTHWYFMKYLGTDPFGHTSRNLQDIFRGMKKDFRNREFKKLRKTPHDHNPVHDSQGNGEVLIHMIQHMGLKGLKIE
jgi:DNA polymerase III alpha subunit (gram-positive type)